MVYLVLILLVKYRHKHLRIKLCMFFGTLIICYFSNKETKVSVKSRLEMKTFKTIMKKEIYQEFKLK